MQTDCTCVCNNLPPVPSKAAGNLEASHRSHLHHAKCHLLCHILHTLLTGLSLSCLSLGLLLLHTLHTVQNFVSTSITAALTIHLVAFVIRVLWAAAGPLSGLVDVLSVVEAVMASKCFVWEYLSC